MKKKRNIIKRNSGFLVGCVLAAGASFVTADTLMEKGVPLMTPSTEETGTGTVETVAPESSENRAYETDAFTVTASGNIIKGVETEPPKQTEKSDTPETDENGNPVNETAQTDENGDPISGGDSTGGSFSDSGSSDSSGSGDGGSYSDDGSYSGDGGSYDSGSSGGDSSYTGDTYYEQPIEIYDPGNGDYYYTDNSGSGSGSSSGSSSSSGGSSNSSASTPSDVILWGISERYIDESELYNYSAETLRLIRNEIFALHGRIFNSQDLRDYFSQKSWYVPTYAPEDFDANMFYYLNDYEEANLNVILNYEAALAGN